MTIDIKKLEAMDRTALDQAGQVFEDGSLQSKFGNRWAHRALGVVLAGGQSSRMNGNDKALIEVDGQQMLARCIKKLQPQVGSLVISGNGDVARYKSELPIVPDLTSDYQGPLAGILATMRWSQANAPHLFWVISVAVDTPFFPDDLVDRFVMAMGGPEPSVVLAQSGDNIHPTFGLWPIALADELEAYLASGERKVRSWAAQHNCSQAHFAGTVIDDIEIDPFFNVNEPDDLPVAEAIAAGLDDLQS